MKKFGNINDLIQILDTHGSYNHEIKGKRLKKQLRALQQTKIPGIKYKSFELTNVAISIIIETEETEKNGGYLILRLDCQYPFNPPQLFYMLPENKNSQYKFCKDLLGNILKEQVWGPSLTLPTFIQKFPALTNNLSKKQKLSWTYHPQFEYGRQQLLKSGIKLFQIQQYTWQYKILKMKKLRVLGLTSDCLLKFDVSLDSQDILKLDFWSNLKDIISVKATPGKKNFQLEIDYNFENKIEKMYLGGKPEELDTILDNLNPIQMVERKVKNYEKSGITDYNEAIQNYTALIEHYSLINKELSEKYMNSMKKVLENHYGVNQNEAAQNMVEIHT